MISREKFTFLQIMEISSYIVVLRPFHILEITDNYSVDENLHRFTITISMAYNRSFFRVTRKVIG